MFRGWAIIALALLIATCQCVFSQQPPAVGSVKLSRYGELLQEHGIELTESALVSALSNSDASVRYLAAMKLAEDKTADAIPAIEQALALEKVPRDRVNMALALALLGAQIGNAELKKVCVNKSFPAEFRLYAVRYMFDLRVEKDEDCLKAAEDIAESKNSDFGARVSALELLSRFRGLTAQESQNVLALVAGRLEDPEPVVRMAAAQSLAELGAASAIPFLEGAVKRESDESVRSVLEASLQKLVGKPGPAPRN
jgi:HEAT repeat protein